MWQGFSLLDTKTRWQMLLPIYISLIQIQQGTSRDPSTAAAVYKDSLVNDPKESSVF